MHAYDTWSLQVEFNLFAVSSTARKAHRNGIKRPKSNRYESLKGVCKMTFFYCLFFSSRNGRCRMLCTANLVC